MGRVPPDWLYLALAGWFEQRNLDGFAQWMKQQWQEEQFHAMKLYNHMMSRGGEVEIQALEKREDNVTSVEEVFETALAYEQHITERINNLYEMAAQKNDYPLQTDRRPIFLH